MVDKACGFNAAAYSPPDPWDAYRKDPEHIILLECASCKRLISTERMKHDPKEAARITFPCNRCNTRVKGAEVQYFDAEGKRVFAAWESQG